MQAIQGSRAVLTQHCHHLDSLQESVSIRIINFRWEYKGTGVWGPTASLEKPGPPAPPMRQLSSVSAVSSSKRSEISFGGASSATQELDDLMMSLNSFRYDLTKIFNRLTLSSTRQLY